MPFVYPQSTINSLNVGTADTCIRTHQSVPLSFQCNLSTLGLAWIFFFFASFVAKWIGENAFAADLLLTRCNSSKIQNTTYT